AATHTREQVQQHLVQLIQRHTATILSHTNPAAINPQRTFKELGFDSLTAVELRNHLTHTTGLRLPPTLVYDHPTPTALATYLLGELGVLDGRPSPLIDELDRLQAMLAGADPDEADRAAITARLEALVRSWTGTTGESTADDGLGNATDDELFDVIDNELGV